PVRASMRLPPGPRRDVQICPGLLCRCYHFHFDRHRTRFCESKPGARTFLAAVINGLLALFLLLAVLLVSTDRKLMKGQPSSPIPIACVGLTTLLMFGAAIGMFIF